MEPLIVDIPHALGLAEAKRRIASGSGAFTRFLPAGAKVDQSWTGDRLDLALATWGQAITAGVEVQDSLVRVSMVLPSALAFFRQRIEAGIRQGGTELLENKS